MCHLTNPAAGGVTGGACETEMNLCPLSLPAVNLRYKVQPVQG